MFNNSPLVISSILLVLSGACRTIVDDGDNTTPEVLYISHQDGVEVPEGIPVQLVAHVEDTDDTYPNLRTTWSVAGREVCASAMPSLEGKSECEVVFSANNGGLVTFEVRDSKSAVAIQNVNLVVIPTSPPVVQMTSPVYEGAYFSNVAVVLEGFASDVQDGPDILKTWWESKGTGVVLGDSELSSIGFTRTTAMLSEGTHTVVFFAEDSAGELSSAQTVIEVRPPNQGPACDITTPAVGEWGTVGGEISFTGEVEDPEEQDHTLVVHWSSDKDGVFASGNPNTQGEVQAVYDGLTADTHIITLTAEDAFGGMCSDSVIYTVSAPPELVIHAPEVASISNEGTAINFFATAYPDNGLPSDLIIEWESDLDGVFSNEGADSYGAIDFSYSALSTGAHHIVLRATDGLGLMAEAYVDLEINALPSAPVVDIFPAQPTTHSELLGFLEAPAIDSDGDSLSYEYQWLINDVISNMGNTQLVPDSATFSGDVWTLSVRAFDGFGFGPAGEVEVVIENALPSVQTPVLTPNPAVATDILRCLAGETEDTDGDVVTLEYQWFVNGQGVGVTTEQLLYPDLSGGDSVQCAVTPFDGIDFGPAISSDTITIVNSAPVISSVSITPFEIYTDSLLTAVVDGTDVDGDTLEYLYEWYVDGVQVTSSESTLDGVVFFEKGQRILVAVTAYDGTDTGTTVWSDEGVVLNSAPIEPGVILEILEPGVVSCAVDVPSVDPDGDAVGYVITGWMGDSGLPHGEEVEVALGGDPQDAILTADFSNGLVGPTWTCEVEVFDEEGDTITVAQHVSMACVQAGDWDC